MSEIFGITKLLTPPAPKLEPDAIGVTQDTVIGMASSAPAGTVAVTLAALAAATAYGSGPIILLTAIPMLVIASAYRRLNMWNANCGASFEWVGRAINPYLGFMTGWLMIAGYVIGTVSEVVVLGPSVLAVFGISPSGPWASIVIDTGLCLLMLVIAIVGIRITAQTQIGMAAIEYAILIGFSVLGLVAVLGHHPGTFHMTWGWLSLTGVGGQGSAVGGFLIAVYVYSAWDGTMYVNEEVKHRRFNPGRAALWAVVLLTVLYTIAQVSLQGVVSPSRLQDHVSTALVYAAQALAGSGWAKLMALSIALSVIAATGTGIVLTSRIVYGMASYKVLPDFLATVCSRFSTPVAASIAVGVLIIAATWVYMLATSIQNAFTDVVAVTGLLYSMFYVMTALAMVAYYRRRIFTRVRDLVVVGLLPLGAVAFLSWILVRSMEQAPLGQVWSVVAIFVVGLGVMLVARFGLRSTFFSVRRESDPGRPNARHGS